MPRKYTKVDQYREQILNMKAEGNQPGDSGISKKPKTILSSMRKYDLLSEIRCRRKWVYMGEQLHKYDNLLNREFHADLPNRKWVTDIGAVGDRRSPFILSPAVSTGFAIRFALTFLGINPCYSFYVLR